MVVAGVWVTPTGTRRKYVHVGSEPASLLATVPAGITHTPDFEFIVSCSNKSDCFVVADEVSITPKAS